MSIYDKFKLFLIVLFLFPFFCNASIIINEIMYNLDGTDTGREWIEIFNPNGTEIDITGWKFYENEINHKINLIDESNNFIIPANGYAIIADNPDKFLLDWADFSGIIFNSSFFLKNTGENLIIRDSELNDIDSVFYNTELGANGDGNSLQKINNNWISSYPSIGIQNAEEQQEQQEQNEENNENSTILSSGISWPVDPQIFADAGGDKISIAGADIKFSGKSIGIKKEPLENTRYFWSFGDGSTKEGQNILHFYQYPGEYIAILNVSSGEYSASDRINIKVIPNKLKIYEVNDDFIKLYNESNITLDISMWFLKSRNKTFKFPDITLIKNNSYLPIPASVSGIKMINNQDVSLLYPNGSIAYLYSSSSNLEVELPSKSKLDTEKSESLQELPKNEDKLIEIKEPIAASSSINQQANIIASFQNDSWGTRRWFFLVLEFSIVVALLFIFIRRKSMP